MLNSTNVKEKMTGIIVIKPDGMRAKVESDLRQALELYDINILKEKTFQFVKEDLIDKIFCDFDKYIYYLTSGLSKAYLVDFTDSEDILYDFKNNFRREKLKNYNKHNIENLIHTADEGLEFLNQMTSIFGERWNYHYCCGSDLLINNISDPYVRRTINKTNLCNLGIIVNNEEDFNHAQELSCFYNVIYVIHQKDKILNRDVDLYTYVYDLSAKNYSQLLICSRKITFLGEVSGLEDSFRESYRNETDPLNYYNIIYSYYKKIFLDIISNSSTIIEGIITETGCMGIHEANSRYFFADEYGLKTACGSKIMSAVGKYFTSNQSFSNLIKFYL